MAMLRKRKKEKRVYRLEEVTFKDLQLLSQAAALQEGYFLCFGLSWYKLHGLNLIDDDSQVTNDGIELLKKVREH